MAGNGDDLSPTRTIPRDEQQRVLRFASLDRGARFAGRYRVIERLGAGGFGEVYHVHDEVAEAEVALKVLYPRRGNDPRSLGRLRRELKIVRSLNHPGIPRLHDIGEDAGFTFLVMELLEGETLRDRLNREGSLEQGQAVGVLDGVLSALSAAHTAGIVHRDVKPSNIMLTRGGPGDDLGRVALLDFGLARGAADATITRTGAFLGTPAYAPPEQASGDSDVGPEADVYSSGIVLWEMLAGSRPFGGEPTPQTVTAHSTQLRPSLKSALPEASGWLRDLAGWMLEKDPARRPRNAGAALDFLREKRRRGLRWHVGRRFSSWWARLLRASPRRRATEFIVAAVLLLSFALVLLAPVEIEHDGNTVRATSQLGVRVRSWSDFPSKVHDVTPLDPGALWPRRHVAMIEDVDPERTPTGMVLLDAMTGGSDVFRLEPWEVWKRGPPQCFAKFDRTYFGQYLEALPWKDRAGRQLFVAGFTHRAHFPNVAVVFNDRGVSAYTVHHPGSVRFLGLVPPLPPDDAPLAVFWGTNMMMGQRTAIFGLSAPTEQDARADVAMPPYRLLCDATTRQVAYYTFLPVHAEPELVDGMAVFTPKAGPEIVVDPRTGVPRDQDPETWIVAQNELLRLLEETVQVAKKGGGAGGAAELLEEYLETPGLSSTQMGVARARAAEFRRHHGDLDLALVQARKALVEENLFPGHWRLLLDLLTRKGRWDEAQRELTSTESLYSPRNSPEAERDLTMAALVAEQVSDAETFVPSPLKDNGDVNYYGVFLRALIRLHEGDPEGADNVLKGHHHPDYAADFALLRAMAFGLMDPPDTDRALEFLDVAKSSQGAGRVPPFVSFRAFLEAERGGEQPTADDIRKELAKQERAGRHDLLDFYFYTWGQAFAARAARERGDLETWERHRRALVSAPGRGPYLERIVGELPDRAPPAEAPEGT